MTALPQVMYKKNAEEEDYESVPAGVESNQRRGISEQNAQQTEVVPAPKARIAVIQLVTYLNVFSGSF
jgi:hypothetical protein